MEAPFALCLFLYQNIIQHLRRCRFCTADGLSINIHGGAGLTMTQTGRYSTHVYAACNKQSSVCMPQGVERNMGQSCPL